MEFIFTSAPDIAWTKVSFEKSDEGDMFTRMEFPLQQLAMDDAWLVAHRSKNADQNNYHEQIYKYHLPQKRFLYFSVRY